MTQFNDTLTNTRLNELRHKEEEGLVRAFAPKYGYAYVNLHETPIDVDALKILPEDESRHGELAIFAHGNERVSVAIRNPQNAELPVLLEKLHRMGFSPTLHLASHESVAYAWER